MDLSTVEHSPHRFRLGRNAIAAATEVVVSVLALVLLYHLIVVENGSEALGAWSVLTAATGTAGLVDIGIGRAIIRFVATSHNVDDVACRHFITTGILSVSIFSATLALLAFVPSHYLITISLPTEWQASVSPLVPLTLAGFWLNNTASATTGVLSALQRTDLSAMVTTTATVLFIALMFMLIPYYGLHAVASGIMVRNILKVMANWIIIRCLIAQLPLLPTSWSRQHFRQMMSYGVKLQTASIAGFLLDPTTRLIMARFGSLQDVGLYEAASKTVQSVRGVIVAINQVLIPVFATLRNDHNNLVVLYRFASERTALLAAIVLGFLLPLSATVSDLWLGQENDATFYYMLILVPAWIINSTTLPNYFLAISAACFPGLVTTHLLQATANVVLGVVFGSFWGPIGVCLGFGVSLCLGSVAGATITHCRLTPGVRLGSGILTRSLLVIVLLIVVATSVSYGHGQSLGFLSGLAFTMAIALVACALVLHRHSFVFPLLKPLAGG